MRGAKRTTQRPACRNLLGFFYGGSTPAHKMRNIVQKEIRATYDLDSPTSKCGRLVVSLPYAVIDKWVLRRQCLPLWGLKEGSIFCESRIVKCQVSDNLNTYWHISQEIRFQSARSQTDVERVAGSCSLDLRGYRRSEFKTRPPL